MKIIIFMLMLLNVSCATASVSPELQPIYALQKTMRKDFKFVNDDIANYDDWQTPDETRSLKKGDCEDYAVLIKAELEKLGYHPIIVGIYSADAGHAIVLFEKGVFNIDDFFPLSPDAKFNDYAELISFGKLDFFAILRQSGKHAVISRKFKRGSTVTVAELLKGGAA